MTSANILTDHINGVGLWIVAQLSQPIGEEEFLARAGRAFPELPTATFSRSYEVFRQTSQSFGEHDHLPTRAVA